MTFEDAVPPMPRNLADFEKYRFSGYRGTTVYRGRNCRRDVGSEQFSVETADGTPFRTLHPKRVRFQLLHVINRFAGFIGLLAGSELVSFKTNKSRRDSCLL